MRLSVGFLLLATSAAGAAAQLRSVPVAESGISFGVDECRQGCIAEARFLPPQSSDGGALQRTDAGSWFVTVARAGRLAVVYFLAAPPVGGWVLDGGSTHRTNLGAWREFRGNEDTELSDERVFEHGRLRVSVRTFRPVGRFAGRTCASFLASPPGERLGGYYCGPQRADLSFDEVGSFVSTLNLWGRYSATIPSRSAAIFADRR